jgi:hypothetical protein
MSKAQKTKPEHGVLDLSLLDKLASEPTRQKAWTEEEDNILIQYHNKGRVTNILLAQMLGRSACSVANRAYRLGLTNRN